MKTKKSIEIRNELDQTIQRLAELTEMQTDLSGNLQTLQDGFISGKTTLDEVQAEQSRLTTLNASITALETKRNELETAFGNQSAAESRVELLEKLVTLGNEAGPTFDEYLAVRAELNEVLARFAAQLLSMIGAYRAKQKEYASIIQQLEPELTDLSQIKPEFRPIYARINKELESLGLSADAIEIVTRKTFSSPDLEFGFSVTATEEILANKLTREAAAVEKKQFNERRMKNFEQLPQGRMPETEKVIQYSQN